MSNDGRTLVLGDVHGAAKALLQVLERSEFDFDADRLVCLGDVVDGWPDTKECFEILADVEHLDYILGNHDEWFMDWWKAGRIEPMWWAQGGKATVQSYMPNVHSMYGAANPPVSTVPKSHKNILRNATVFLIEIRPDGREVLYVHAGWDPNRSREEQNNDVCMWARGLWESAVLTSSGNITEFDEVFVGHTTTDRRWLEPRQCCEVWNLDQGAGWSGKLTIMDADTHEYWQSDLVESLYPEFASKRT